MKETLAGYSNLDLYSYYYIAVMPCVGYNFRKEECQPLENVENFFTQNYLEFKLQDVVMTPKNYDNPSEARTMDIRSPVFSGLYQSIYAYMQIVNLETDKDWLGFDGLSAIKKEQFLRYDESWIIAAPSLHMKGLIPNKPITDITIQLSSKVLTTKRSNTKLIELLGEVGGLMEVISSIFHIISAFIADLLYDIDIVNNLFSFDLTRKVVIMKKNLNKIIKIPTTIEKNIYDKKNIENDINNIKFRMAIDKFEENKNDNIPTIAPNIRRIKVKKKKKLKYSKLITSNGKDESKKKLETKKIDIINNNENSKINEPEKGTILSNNLMMTTENIVEKKPVEIESKNKIIDEIKINKFCIVFAFCCIRKRKNVNNFVLTEGLSIISTRLDILNIFKRLYYDEKVQESFVKENDEINMSDDCKRKINLK